MSKINWKGITKENVISVALLVLALVNAILRMFGFDTLPISNDDISNAVSTLFLIATTAYGVYKNFNTSPASQIAQRITDGIKNGEIFIDQVEDMINKLKEKNTLEKEK